MINNRFYSILMFFAIFMVEGCHNQVYEKPAAETVILSEYPVYETTEIWPVLPPLNRADGLRPCCAFGYDLNVELGGIPIPFYTIGNIVEAEHLGNHSYNDSLLKSAAMIMAMSDEQVGILYTKQGGFIDVAHVRDTIDNTLYLFSHIYAHLGEEYTIELDSEELMDKRIQLFKSSKPLSDIERYNLSAYLAAKFAYEMAVWHEIAQWNNYRSVFFISERISAFSPEDLYSNLLGARIALDLILHGYAQTHEQFNQATTYVLPDVLKQLGAVDKAETKAAFDKVDGVWWDSHQRVPEMHLVLYRDYDTDDYLIPAHSAVFRDPLIALALARDYKQYMLSEFGQLQFWPINGHSLLETDRPFLTRDDFKVLAEKVKREATLLLGDK